MIASVSGFGMGMRICRSLVDMLYVLMLLGDLDMTVEFVIIGFVLLRWFDHEVA